MLITLAAPFEGHAPDETIDVDDNVGRLMVREGYARIPSAAGSTIPEILAAVGTDPLLARTALDAELARGDKARSSLIGQLTELADTTSADGADNTEAT